MFIPGCVIDGLFKLAPRIIYLQPSLCCDFDNIPQMSEIDLTATKGIMSYDEVNVRLMIAGNPLKVDFDPITDLVPYLPDYIDKYSLSTKGDQSL